MSTVSTQTWRVAEPRKTSADDLVRKVRSLLNGQELTAAKEAAARGARLFPGHRWLAQANKVLNPSKVTTRLARDEGVDRGKEYDWLRQNREKYQGKWVVLLEDELIACADSFEDVVRVARSRDLKARPLVHHVE